VNSILLFAPHAATRRPLASPRAAPLCRIGDFTAPCFLYYFLASAFGQIFFFFFLTLLRIHQCRNRALNGPSLSRKIWDCCALPRPKWGKQLFFFLNRLFLSLTGLPTQQFDLEHSFGPGTNSCLQAARGPHNVGRPLPWMVVIRVEDFRDFSLERLFQVLNTKVPFAFSPVSWVSSFLFSPSV